MFLGGCGVVVERGGAEATRRYGCDVVLAGASEGGSGQAAVLAFLLAILFCWLAAGCPDRPLRWGDLDSEVPYFVRRWALTMDMGARGCVFSRY